jgi:hypothetical protein
MHKTYATNVSTDIPPTFPHRLITHLLHVIWDTPSVAAVNNAYAAVDNLAIAITHSSHVTTPCVITDAHGRMASLTQRFNSTAVNYL